MCQSNCHHPEPPTSEPQPRDWLDKLFSIVDPLVIATGVFGAILFITHVLITPIHLDPDFLWVLKTYLGLLGLANLIIIGTVVYRIIRRDGARFKRCVRYLVLDRRVRSTTIRLASIQGELNNAQDSYTGFEALGERGRELSREIVHLTEYRDALMGELASLTAELKADGVLDKEGKQS